MPSAYLSHPIRGVKGDNATRAEMEENNRRACAFAAKIREACPSLDLYCPGEHDELVQEGMSLGTLTAAQILDIDQHLIPKRDFLIVYVPDDHFSGGMLLELQTAAKYRMPVVVTTGDLLPIEVMEGMLR